MSLGDLRLTWAPLSFWACFLGYLIPLALATAGEAPLQGVAVAGSAARSPVIDGELDDPAWQRAQWFDDFVQKAPVYGKAPSRKTAFAVTYDENAIYFAVRCHVQQRKEIVTRLLRRDRVANFDYVEITLSPRGDGRTGYTFTVNPSGVKQDKYWSDDRVSDTAWDAVWHAETAVTDSEWTAEIAIPFDQLRFTGRRPSFGLQVARWVAARKELYLFHPVPDDRSGAISNCGTLLGVSDIEGKEPLTLIPESYVSYATTTSGYDTRRRDGLDFGGGGYAKVGLGSDLVLDLAVNPDFGQVEVDEVLLNLTAYEIRFPEHRPFFLEGAGLFTTPIELFYSRRIGQPPPDPDLGDGESVRHGNVLTPILGAARITGRTERGLTVGLLDAVMLPTELVVENEDTGNRARRQGTPWTHAAAFRSITEMGKNSTVGVLGTALNPAGSGGAYSGGMDWNLLSNRREYSFRGQAAGTIRLDDVPGKDPSQGGALWTQVEREGGEPFRYLLSYDVTSKGFDPNDLGYKQRNNLHHYWGQLYHFHLRGAGPLEQLYSGVGADGNWNLDGVMLYHSAWFWQSHKWRNHWTSDVNLSGGPPHYDDRETRGGPKLKRPAFGTLSILFETPSEKPPGLRMNGVAATREHGYALTLATVFMLRLGRVELEFMPRIKRIVGDVGWVENLNDGEEDEMSVVGRRDLTELYFSLKGTVVFTRDLTLQLHSQLLTVGVDYHHYEEVLENGERRPVIYQDDAGNLLEADFTRTDLILQPLLRWEYLPGSALYIIYTHRGYVDIDRDSSRMTDSLSNLDDEEREQVVMVKLSHRFG